jgi:hypothetical protein
MKKEEREGRNKEAEKEKNTGTKKRELIQNKG